MPPIGPPQTAPPGFPDTAGMERSQDGSEPILGGSIAINRLLNHLRDTAGTGTPWRLWLINLYTLFDNLYTDLTITGAQLDTALRTEVQLLTQYIEAYASYLPGPPRRPDIIFYAPDYAIIPTKLRREISPETKTGQLRRALDRAFQVFRTTRILPQTTPSPAVVRFIPVGQGSYPHRDLVRWLRAHSAQLQYIYDQDPVALITHCPIDLHIRRYLKQLFLLERYTGHILQPAAFGKKLPASEDVPFNIYTHQLFGDQVHLASRIKGKLKSQLLQVAKDRTWRQRSELEILADIRRLTQLESRDFPLKL